jgi:urease accessory protein
MVATIVDAEPARFFVDPDRTALLGDPRRSGRMGAGSATLVLARSGARTVLTTALAHSPLRLLTPRNHGHAAWVFLASFGGGLVDGDHLRVTVDVHEGAFAMLGTQASTKVYRSPAGCAQSIDARVGAGGSLAILPDPVVCFAGARYAQETRIALDASASALVFDAYTAGRSARGERWDFDRYASRTSITRDGAPLFADGTLLDPAHGSIRERMGRYESIATLVIAGPRFAPLRAAVLASASPCTDVIVAAGPIAGDAAVLRIASTRFEKALSTLQSCVQALASVLGDDPFARKW